jgi:hypothetical protein
MEVKTSLHKNDIEENSLEYDVLASKGHMQDIEPPNRNLGTRVYS